MMDDVEHDRLVNCSAAYVMFFQLAIADAEFLIRMNNHWLFKYIPQSWLMLKVINPSRGICKSINTFNRRYHGFDYTTFHDTINAVQREVNNHWEDVNNDKFYPIASTTTGLSNAYQFAHSVGNRTLWRGEQAILRLQLLKSTSQMIDQYHNALLSSD
jgi:hypothetical protein